MFTGIITDIGRVVQVTHTPGADTRLRILCTYPLAHLRLGDSIACDGICLTVVASGEEDALMRRWFEVEASTETLDKTTLGSWQATRFINLERALALGDVLGGHLVSGHVDGVGTLISSIQQDGSHVWQVQAPQSLLPYLATKGSVVVDGTSLTVNAVEGDRFFLNLIPHTFTHTALGNKKPGDVLNLEIDLIARYVERMLATRFAKKD